VWQRVYEEIDEGAYAACQLGNLFRARGQKTKAERY
jgi:hypothetical protein